MPRYEDIDWTRPGLPEGAVRRAAGRRPRRVEARSDGARGALHRAARPPAAGNGLRARTADLPAVRRHHPIRMASPSGIWSVGSAPWQASSAHAAEPAVSAVLRAPWARGAARGRRRRGGVTGFERLGFTVDDRLRRLHLLEHVAVHHLRLAGVPRLGEPWLRCRLAERLGFLLGRVSEIGSARSLPCPRARRSPARARPASRCPGRSA